MTCDHAGKIAFPSLFEETHAIGRLAYPLFAGIVALRIGINPNAAAKYLRTLLPWAIASQPFYVLAGRDWTEGNILCTLALGVVAFVAVQSIREGSRWKGFAAVACTAFLGAWVEYGIAGVAMIPAVGLIATVRPNTAVASVGPFGVIANLVPALPALEGVDLLALLTTPVLLTTMPIGAHLPRLPKHAFYAYYPFHLLALHTLDTYWL